MGGGAAGMMAGMKSAAVAGAAVAGAAAGSATSTALNAIADGMDKAIGSLDEEFAKVGAEVTEKKVDDIIAVFKEVINGKKVDNPKNLVEQGVDSAAVCDYIVSNAAQELSEKILEKTKEVVQESTACKSWKKVIDVYNQANESLDKLGEMGQKVKQEPITLDIDKYIVDQIVKGYRDLMATKEALVRADPKTAAVPSNPTTFERCWKTIKYEDFKDTHYNDFKYNGL